VSAEAGGDGRMSRWSAEREIEMRALVVFLAVTTSFGPAAAQDDLIAKGRALAEENCARCHAVGGSGESPLAAAPPFRTLSERYPVSDLEESLAEGIVSGHPEMPEFVFEPDQVGALIAYLESIQPT
jgi:mono/diheme cytochrome c family protein